MKFDLIYKVVGEFGPYQHYVVWLGSLNGVYFGLLFINSVFVLFIPNHRCAIPGLDNDTFKIQSDFHQYLVNRTIPVGTEPGDIYDKCHVLKIPRGNGSETIKETCDRWVYDDSVFTATLAAKLNMVCDRAILKSNAQMMFFGGLLTGSFITGIISDRFGRKPTMCVSSLLYFGAALAIAWTPSFEVYIFLTFCVGFFSVGNFMPSFVMSMEFVGPSWRRFAGMLGAFTWMLGNVILAGLGYGIRDWVTLQIVCASPGILFQLYWVIFPESARWLYSQGRLKESEAIIKKAAKINKVNLPPSFFEKVFSGTVEPPTGRLWHMFTTKALALRTIVIYFNWLVVCLAYYGLALNSGDLGGDLFLNFFFQALMDLPANIIVILTINKLGRRKLMVASMLAGGTGCLTTIFPIMFAGKDLQILTTILALIGKVGASAAFSTVYIYTAELFPTVVRNQGMGSSSCMARVGGMIAPYIADLDRLVGGKWGRALPQIVFGSLCVVAGFTCLYLPETLNKNLPETVEQAKLFGRKETSDTDYQLEKNGTINKGFDKTGEKINKALDRIEFNTQM